MAKNKALVFAIIIIVGLMFLVFAFVEQTSASITPEVSTTCPSGKVAQNESAVGSFQCITNGGLSASTCPNPQFAQNFSGSVVVCNTIPVPYLYIVNDSCGLAITNCAGCVSLPCSNGIITAYPTVAGLTKYSGTDCATVLNNAFSQALKMGVFIKTGSYYCNSQISLTQTDLITGEFGLSGATQLFWTTFSSSTGSITGIGQLNNIELVTNTTSNNAWVVICTNACYISNTEIVNLQSTNSNGLELKSGGNIINNMLFATAVRFSTALNITSSSTNNVLDNILAISSKIEDDRGGNKFNNIVSTIQLDSGVKNDTIANCVTICAVTDNSGQTTNQACPALTTASGDLYCESWTQITSFPVTCSPNAVITIGKTLTCGSPNALSVKLPWSNLTSFPSACTSGQFVTANGVSNTCNGILNEMFNNTKSCTDVTANVVKQAGFKLNFTTLYNTNTSVTVNFEIVTPATINLDTRYRLSFGNGTAPACNAAQTGTGLGNQYRLNSFGGTAATAFSMNEQFSLTAVIPKNLTPNTVYWVDVQAIDSTSASWIYANATMTVVQG